MFVRADDIAQDLDVSVPYAYKLIRAMNAELKAKGFMTVTGRVSRQFYEEKFYGIAWHKDRQLRNGSKIT
jgi:hypothetical protein